MRLALTRGLLAVAAAFLLAACGTRSISNSGYGGENPYYGARGNPLYKGELSEFDVLGVDPRTPVTEADVRRALAERTRLNMPRGSALLLIQSGALIPDEDMVKDLEKYYAVGVFSGTPGDKNTAAAGYAGALRLAAARAGCARLMVYWGMLETGHENLATQAVSWFPFVGGVLPDRTQRMRIRMKVALIDVASGQWETFTPPPFEDRDTSSRYGREASDQAQVALLKQKAYAAAVEDLVKRFSN